MFERSPFTVSHLRPELRGRTPTIQEHTEGRQLQFADDFATAGHLPCSRRPFTNAGFRTSRECPSKGLALARLDGGVVLTSKA
jgi:hypothetical protein